MTGQEKILLDQHEKRLDKTDDEIKTKVSIKLYLGLVFALLTIFGGNLGFQLLIYDSIKAVDKKIAVVETQVISIEKRMDSKYITYP